MFYIFEYSMPMIQKLCCVCVCTFITPVVDTPCRHSNYTITCTSVLLLLLLYLIIVWFVLKLGRRQRSGTDTIKYHAWTRTPNGKVTKTQENFIYKKSFFAAQILMICGEHTASLESALSAIIQDLKLNLRTISISLIQYFEDDVIWRARLKILNLEISIKTLHLI